MLCCMVQHMLTRALMLLWHMPHFVYLGIATATYAAVRRWWVQLRQRLISEESKAWPTYRGRVVAVQAVRDGTDENKGKWCGLLTYSYIADEVEIGEYRQPFDSEDEADEWVRALRGGVVTVAVDPKDQRRSIWKPEEADATRKLAEGALLDAETAELSPWLEVRRVATLAVAVTGALTSAAIEVRELILIYTHATATSAHAVAWLSTGSLACSGIAAYVFAKRFPGSRMADIGKRFKDPFISLFLKVLGIVEGSLFVGLWWSFGEGDLANKLTSSSLFSALWGGLFAAASIALWVCGQRLPVEHELAPKGLGPSKL
jgi:hypothetical protein